MKLILVFCPSESAENVFTKSFFDTCKHYALREFPDCLQSSQDNEQEGGIFVTFVFESVCSYTKKIPQNRRPRILGVLKIKRLLGEHYQFNGSSEYRVGRGLEFGNILFKRSYIFSFVFINLEKSRPPL